MKLQAPVMWRSPIPLYSNLEVVLILADDLLAGAKMIEDLINPEDHKIKPTDKCLTNEDQEGNFVMIFRRNALSYGSVGHEIAHCAGYIAKYLGIRYDPDNDEPFAYLIGWLSDFTYGHLPKNLKPSPEFVKTE